MTSASVDYLAVCNVPLANVRREPRDGDGSRSHDDLQETQVLFGETLRVTEVHRSWCRVEALEQQKTDVFGNWKGYPGWVRRDALRATECPTRRDVTVAAPRARVYSGPSAGLPPVLDVLLGACLARRKQDHDVAGFVGVALPDGRTGWIARGSLSLRNEGLAGEALREACVRTARLFLGTPYLWGGRSIHLPGSVAPFPATGVDCSGLTDLVFRVHGIELPRDAQDQWVRAQPIGADALMPADLIFLFPPDAPARAHHVLIYAGGEELIDARETGGEVAGSSFVERFGCPLRELSKSPAVRSGTLRCGRMVHGPGGGGTR